ncbi:MAG: adenosine-specific kinase [archaeon GB-1845-036]|nr:adenosine-specific kinase [Candidatus Culexmicrobium thermophilum]HDO20642.1 adenosine monophosphate-protein transferase [Candidatus Bathyarchaeota archaeon]
MKMEVVELKIPEGCNIILGQSHFIKTVEDLYEAMVNSTPNVKFGLAFCESSGPCLIRFDGNDEELKKIAVENAEKLSAGHCFIIVMRNAYPINVLDRIKTTPEVVSLFCATANPVQVIVAETEQGRGILGVIDGRRSRGVEGEEEVKERVKFLRNIGYKKG